MSGGIYGQFETPIYRSIPDLLETPREDLSFREKHRIRIFDQFEPITEADLNPVDSLPLIDRGVQTTPLPDIATKADPKNAAESVPPALKERSMTWQWPRLRPNDTYRVIKKVRDAQAQNTYGFAYYSELAQEELSRSPTVVKPSRGGPKPTKRARLVPLENASCGIAMEVAKADSKTNWEALMNHINESIRDTQQQRMLGQYMIHKLKKEQEMANIPPDQAATNKRCLESLIERYGTGLEGVVSKEREFERLIEAYQVFMRGDKKKMQRKVERKQQSSRKLKPVDEPLPAIGDQKAGRSQVGCKIRQELRKEYGERVRLDFANKSTSSKRVLLSQPGGVPKPMHVRVRKSVLSGQEEKEEEPREPDRASDEVDLPPTPVSPDEAEEAADDGLEETESLLSMTYVPSENHSVAQLIPEESLGISVEFKPEEELVEETETQQEPYPIETEPSKEETEPSTEETEELEADDEAEASASEECLVLEGDSDPNVLIVNSQTELIPSYPAQSPKFEIVSAQSLVDQEKESPVAKLDEDTKPETTEPKDELVVTEPTVASDPTPEPSLAQIVDEPEVVPAKEEEKAPEAEEEKVPETEQKAPEAEEEKVPVAIEEKVLEAEEEKVPAAVQEKVPEVEEEKVPEAEVENAPEAEVEKAPEAEVEKAPEAEDLVEESDTEVYQTVAIDLVNGILQKIDIESASDDGSEQPDLKEVHFKSSPEIVFYDKLSTEGELACNTDDRVILSEDLSTAETELAEEAKPLYHKVLSTAHTEPEVPVQQKPVENEEGPKLTEIARELTDTAIKNATNSEVPTEIPISEVPISEVPNSEEPKENEEERSASPVSETAKKLTDAVLRKASTTVQ